MMEVDWGHISYYYDLRTTPIGTAVFSIEGDQLLIPAEAKTFLKLYADMIKAQELDPACTYFGGWMGAVCSAVHYLMSFHQSSVDLSLNNLKFQLYRNDHGHPSIAFVLNNVKLLPHQEVDSRPAWRQATMERFYKGTVRPVFESIAAAAEVNPAVIWSVLPTGVYHRYDQMLRIAEHCSGLTLCIQDDFAYMTQEIKGEVFGRSRNPFAVTFNMIPSLKNQNELQRQKAGCCLYYRTEGGAYCYSCPRINDEQRKEIRKELLSQS